jgi:acyl-CoA synthetase (AMP-forming)/AMP-acid ligase II
LTDHRASARYPAPRPPFTPSSVLVSPDDRAIEAVPFVVLIVEELFGAWTAGSTLVLRTEQMLESPEAFCEACAELRVSVMSLPTAYWHTLVDALHASRARLPGTVREVIIGGERAREDRLDAWYATVGASVGLMNTYGPTETTVVATAAELNDRLGKRTDGYSRTEETLWTRRSCGACLATRRWRCPPLKSVSGSWNNWFRGARSTMSVSVCACAESCGSRR